MYDSKRIEHRQENAIDVEMNSSREKKDSMHGSTVGMRGSTNRTS